MSEPIAYSASEHPAPHGERVGLLTLFYGLFAPPIIWAANFMISYGLVSYACFPGSSPALAGPRPGLGVVFWLVVACYALTLAVCVSAAVVGWRNWRLAGGESHGHAGDLLEAGEGRTRFLSMISMAFALMFFIATAFGMLIFAFEPLCAYE